MRDKEYKKIFNDCKKQLSESHSIFLRAGLSEHDSEVHKIAILHIADSLNNTLKTIRLAEHILKELSQSEHTGS